MIDSCSLTYHVFSSVFFSLIYNSLVLSIIFYDVVEFKLCILYLCLSDFMSICLSLIYVLYICLSIFVFLDVLIVFVACSILPCKYPATCVDGATTDEYTCVCTEGYSGTNCDTVAGM